MAEIAQANMFKERTDLCGIIEEFSNQLVAEQFAIQDKIEAGDIGNQTRGFFEPWALKFIKQISEAANLSQQVQFEESKIVGEPQEKASFSGEMSNSSLKAQMRAMVDEFAEAVCEIETENKTSIAMLKEDWSQLDNNMEQLKTKQKKEEIENNRRYLNVPETDNSSLIQLAQSSQADLDTLITGLSKKNEQIQQAQKVLIVSTNQSMNQLLKNLIQGAVNKQIKIEELRLAGNTHYAANRLVAFPSQQNLNDLHKQSASVNFRLISVSRPNDSSKNRWNFIFSNDMQTTTDLELPCTVHTLKEEGRNLVKVDVFQGAENPLYGLEFHFENGQRQMVGLTGSKQPATVILAKNERIVGIKNRNDKQMYRYGLVFMIAKDSEVNEMDMPSLNMLGLNADTAKRTISLLACKILGDPGYNAAPTLSFPDQARLDRLCQSGTAMSNFRLVGVSRPNDSSKNRWNFIFENDLITDTNLEISCERVMLPNDGRNLQQVIIYQNGDDPLWGMKFIFEGGVEKMLGKTNSINGKICNLNAGERIVGIKHKLDKPMYRYHLSLIVANDAAMVSNDLNVPQPMIASTINIQQLQERGNIQFTADRLTWFPNQSNFDEYSNRFNLSAFCLTGVRRPTDQSKNRWNFIFNNGIRSQDDLEMNCSDSYLAEGGRILTSIRIFQDNSDPLYGLKFTYNTGGVLMVGHTNNLAGKLIELQPYQRVVGIRYRKDKPMYRYGLRFIIA